MNDGIQNGLPTEDHEIILIGVGEENYFLYRGEEYLSQLLLADGTYPTPVCCLRFANVLDVKLMLGESVSVANNWAVHPEVVARLRKDEKLIETEA
ncbi:hypothetical protein OB2597_13468 [Pseudooceanicola batsensis HTCC2597]|uniref:Uncharacterized protein n=1 Tax=Pseudooceanicola batsensis (strain ATCC BAA-863 / DSM 15984 / KCTC 12145 / HTCC2597) TaxID=252305 RepID=A3TYC2_PSEBH|nr:hypothetical protein [Pseudooceanicola batsensis]EAQ03156.1 hypothetical protein OB2597_13468 [Pseudooceanicola batsensis HTCC2597]